jgi:hypothetical protein
MMADAKRKAACQLRSHVSSGKGCKQDGKAYLWLNIVFLVRAELDDLVGASLRAAGRHVDVRLDVRCCCCFRLWTDCVIESHEAE